LLSAEPLRLALSQLEAANLAQDQQLPELTRYISLKQINPFALFVLRETGTCDFTFDEALFDLDNPGHYFRRLHSIAVTIPCVAGPNTSISATLRQNSSMIRLAPDPSPTAASYPRRDDDPRFKTISLPTEQVIVTSTAREDFGLFDTSIHDDRYRPFEGTGAISSYTLSFASEFQQFNRRTISDVLLLVRMTAKIGGADFATAASGALRKEFDDIALGAGRTGVYRFLSAQHDFPDDWHRYLATGAAAPLTLTIGRELISHPLRPFAKAVSTGSVVVYAKPNVPALVADAIELTVQGPDAGPWTITVPPMPGGGPTDDAYLFLKFSVG
jgi:hypothetical protein